MRKSCWIPKRPDWIRSRGIASSAAAIELDGRRISERRFIVISIPNARSTRCVAVAWTDL